MPETYYPGCDICLGPTEERRRHAPERGGSTLIFCEDCRSLFPDPQAEFIRALRAKVKDHPHLRALVEDMIRERGGPPDPNG